MDRKKEYTAPWLGLHRLMHVSLMQASKDLTNKGTTTEGTVPDTEGGDDEYDGWFD